MEKLNLTSKTTHSTDDALKGISALFVDGDRVFIDNGAIHAKSQLEKSIQFVKDRSQLSDQARTIWVFWITLKRFEGVQGFAGAMAFELVIDDSQGLGYKSLAEQVNKMDKAVRGTVDIANVPKDVVAKASAFLQSIRVDLWEHGAPAFIEAFTSGTEG